MSRYQPTRRSVLRATGLATATAIAGCLGTDSGGTDDGTGDGEIHILTDLTGEQWEPYWEDELIAGFESSADASVSVEYAGMQGQGGQRLATLLQSNTPPECYHATQTEIGDLFNQGLTQSVDSVIDELESIWGETLFKYTMQPFNGDRDEEMHMIPNGIYVGGVFNYRKDIYEKLGLSVPTTWQGLVDNAKAIHESDDVQAAGFGVAGTPAGKSGSDFSNWLFNAGGQTWKSAGDSIELAFEKEHVMAVLEVLQELANYSPDPSSLSWAKTIEYWAGGRIAQCFMNNAWLCGPAYAAGATEIARNTEQALIPIREGADPITRGWILANGTPIIKGSSNPEGAKAFNKYMFGEEHMIPVSQLEPMRFIPPYADVMDADAYRNAEIFQVEDGIFLEKNEKIVSEIVPELDNADLPSSPETLHVGTIYIQDQMVNRVLIEGQSPEAAYEWALDEYETQISNAQQQANY